MVVVRRKYDCILDFGWNFYNCWFHNGGNAVYKIPTGQLNSIEFSDQLCCIHFIGSVTVTYTGSNLRSEIKSGCYFYVEKGYEKEILSELTRTCGKDIIYRNR